MLNKAIFTIGLALSLAAQQKRGTSLAGVVTGTNGELIGGATVEATLMEPSSRVPSRRPGVPFVRSATTGPDGSFRLNKLPAGMYAICVQLSESEWLSSCTWGRQPVVAEATDSGSDPISIALRKGAAISIQIEDVGGALARHEEKTAGAHLLVGVGGDDLLFRPAQLATTGGATRLYRVLVPFDTSVKLVVGSTLFRLADERGVPIDSMAKVMPVRVAHSQVLPPVRLLVTGTRIP